MKRREFLKKTGYGLAGAAFIVPVLSLIDDKNDSYKTIDCSFKIYENGYIKYVGNDDKQYTVKEFHDFLKNQVAAELRTDNLLNLHYPWHIDVDTAKALKDGAIIQNDPAGNDIVWHCFTKIGNMV